MSSEPTAPTHELPPLHVIGMGADGMDGLSVNATRALFKADVIYTSSRLAALLAEPLQGKVRPWPVPFDAMVEDIRTNRKNGRQVVVLATGNPFHYGIGSVLAQHFPPAEMRVWPAPSAFALAAARLGWALQDVRKLSLHGRDARALEPHLLQHNRILLLTEPNTLGEVARRLQRRHLNGSRVVVLGNLGGPDERIYELSVEEALAFDNAVLTMPHVIALECRHEDAVRDFHALAASHAPGLPDAAFVHDGQITKAPIRAITIAALLPRPRTRLWDIGAGCGSIATEWLLMAGHTAHAVAIERDARRCRMIEHNADALGAPNLRIVQGAAPQALDGLPRPDVVFLGGAVASEEVFASAFNALPRGGWLVANAVSLQAEQALLARHAQYGGELLRLSVAQAAPLGGGAALQMVEADDTSEMAMAEQRASLIGSGGYSVFRPSLPVTQWRVRKG